MLAYLGSLASPPGPNYVPAIKLFLSDLPLVYLYSHSPLALSGSSTSKSEFAISLILVVDRVVSHSTSKGF